MVAASAIAQDTRRVTIESEGTRREYKRVDHDGYVRLSRRLSDAPCIQGRSWGYDRDGIWVSNGCRAVFEYRTGWNGRGDRRDDRRDDRWDDRYDREDRWYGSSNAVKVESDDGRYKSKRIDTRGGVRLLRTLSDAPCIQGRSWGYDRDRIWVDRGCRALFEVGRGGGGYNDDRYNGGYGGYGGYDECPTWLPGRYSGYDSGRELSVVIDRNGRVTLRRNSNGRWGNDEYGYYRNNAVHVGGLIFDIFRDNNRVNLRSNRGGSRFDLRKM